MHQVLKNIRNLRKRYGFSQEYMGECLGITQSTYTRFENEGKKIDFKLIERIAAILEVSTTTVIDYHNLEYAADSPLVQVKERKGDYSHPELELWKEKARHLEELNSTLNAQLKDKEEIIALLKRDNS